MIENLSLKTASQSGTDMMDLLKAKQAEIDKLHPEYKKQEAAVDNREFEMGHCDEHGDFNLYIKSSFSGKFWGPIGCPECAKIKKAEEEKAELDREMLQLTKQRLAHSKVPKRYEGKKVSDIDCEYHSEKKNNDTTKLMARTISKYIDTFGERFDQGSSGFFSGECGTGKTMAACIVIESVIHGGHSGLYTTAWNLIQDIRRSYNTNDNAQDIIRKYVNIDFLVIDEVGVQGGTNDERVLLYQVIDGRYNNMKPSLLISNSKNPVDDGFLDARTIDRLKENGGFSICLGGDSYRCNK